MERWIDSIKKCFGIEEPLLGAEPANVDFDILNGADSSEVIRVLSGNGAAAYSWQSSDADFLLAAGKVVVSDPLDQESAIDELFSRLYGDECDADIFSMREVIIDDMQGVELCGITEGDDESVFYALYLADNTGAYFVSGFSTGEPEFAFDEFSGAVRTFYRKPQPATVNKGKSNSPVLTALRALASKTAPNESSNHIIRNTTFDVEDGIIADEFAVAGIADDDVESSSGKEFYENIGVEQEAQAFLSMLANKFDITGFTVTNFEDGRYSVTFYPLVDEDGHEEDGHECCGEHDCGCGNGEHKHNHGEGCCGGGGKKGSCGSDSDSESELDDSVTAFISKLTPFFPKNWKSAVCLMVPISENEDEWAFDALISDGGAYKPIELPDSVDDAVSEEFADLSEAIDENFDETSVFMFSFDKDPDTGAVDESSVSFKDYLFDEYFDSCGAREGEDGEEFSKYTDILHDELNGSEPVISASFKLCNDDNGVFYVVPPYVTTADGERHIELGKDKLDAILNVASKMLDANGKGEICSVFTLFPDTKLGILFEERDENIVLDNDSLDELLTECELLDYSKPLKKLARSEISASYYDAGEVDMIASGVSKVGGSPDLAADEKWPADSTGVPMLFIAQVNLSETKPFDSEKLLPETGRLAFFYNESSNEGKVLYTDSTKLSRISFTDALERGDIEPAGIESGLREFLPALLRFSYSLSLPVMVEGETLPQFLPEEKEDMYQDIAWLNDKVKMFGYPFIPAEDTELSVDKNKKLLFQLPSLFECEMDWNNGGTLYFWIDSKDLKNRMFDKCICETQSYEPEGKVSGWEE